MDEKMQDMLEYVENTKLEMGKILKAIEMTEQKQNEIDLKEEDMKNYAMFDQNKANEVKAEIDNLKKEKDEFDEMTINGLKGVVKNFESQKNASEKYFNNELLKLQEQRKLVIERAEKFSKRTDVSLNEIQKANVIKDNKLEEIQNQINALVEQQKQIRQSFSEFENQILEYSKRLDVEKDIQKYRSEVQKDAKEENEELNKDNGKDDKKNEEQNKDEKNSDELSNLKKELADVARRMREAKDNGDYEREAALHSEYNDLVKRISELEKNKNKQNDNKNQNGWEITDGDVNLNDDMFDRIWGNDSRKRDGQDQENGIEKDGIRKTPTPEPEPEKEKEGIKTIPTPTPEPEPEKGKDDNKPEPEPEQELQQKLPRHWVEIMAATQTQSSGSIITNLHNMGKIQPLRMGPGIVFAPIKGIMKGFGLLTGDLIGRAEAKKREMRQNIENLSPEEFEILVKGLNETNMRQYKVNNIYLEAVHEVLAEREAARKQELIAWDNAAREAINQCREQIDEINRQLANPALTNEQRDNLTLRLNQCILAERNSRIAHNAVYNEEVQSDMRVTNFERGMRGKSSQKMNIQGWFAARFNPDNRELHRQMADAYRERREAAERGDTVAESEAQRRIEQFKTDNTHVIQLLSGTRFETRARINRGLHTRETVHVKPSDADQNKGREMIAAIMAGVTFWNLARTAHDKIDTSHAMDENQRLVNQKIDEHNKAIDSVNEHNKGVQSEIDSANQANGSIQGPDISKVVSDKDMRVAFKNEIHNNNMANHSVAHNGEFLRDNNGVGFNHGGSDDAIHAAQDVMRSSRVAAQKGSLNDLMNESKNSYDSMLGTVQQELPTAQQFMSVPGKSGFINSEYVINMQHLAPYEQTTAGLLSNIYNYFKSAAPIKGTQVAGSVQMAPYMDPITLSNVVVDIPNHVLANSLPFVLALANVVNLENQKAQKNNESRNHDRERVILPDERNNTQNTPEQENNQERPVEGGRPIDLGLPEDRIIRRHGEALRNSNNHTDRPINVIYSDNRDRAWNNWGGPINQPENDEISNNNGDER